MKKYLSVFTLIARESLFRLPMLWILSAAVQAASFYYAFFYKEVQFKATFSSAFVYDGISPAVIFVITVFLTGLLLMKTGMEFRTKSGYTLRRLRISEKKVFLVQSVYNSIMLVMLLFAEVILIFILLKQGYGQTDERYVTNQSVYLGFYCSEFISNLFAGRDILRAVRNLFLLVSLGFNLSAFTFCWRRNKKYLFGIVFFVLAMAFFILPTDTSSWGTDAFGIAAAAGALGLSVYVGMRGSEAYDI